MSNFFTRFIAELLNPATWLEALSQKQSSIAEEDTRIGYSVHTGFYINGQEVDSEGQFNGDSVVGAEGFNIPTDNRVPDNKAKL